MKKKNTLLWILIAIGLYSLSRGIWYDYQSLWLQENGFSIETISILEALCSLGAVSASLIFFNYITKKRLKIFAVILLFLKILICTIIFIFHNSCDPSITKVLILYDNIINTEILVTFYPLLTLFKTDDKLFGKKGLVTSTMYDIGIMFSCFFLGRKIFGLNINYDLFLLLSLIFCFMTFIIIKSIPIDDIKEEESNISNKLFSFIKKDKITKFYFGYTLANNISYYTVTGLKVLLLTSIVGLSVSKTSLYILVISIISDIVGIIILKKLTLKNNYINIFIKYGIRTILYFVVFLFPNNITCIIALSYIFLFSNSYSHITDAPYTNRISNECQLAFANIQNIIGYTGKAIGVWISGFAFIFGIKYVFLIGFISCAIQFILCIICNYLLKQKQS